MEPYERLRQARQEAGYSDAAAAAAAMGIPAPTYFGHENGTRGLSRSGQKYAEFFRVSLDWLLRGRGSAKRNVPATPPAMVPLAGYVSAGSAVFIAQDLGYLDEVEAPAGSSPDTVAVEIRGDSLGTFFDRWLVYYDDVHRPVTAGQIGQLCVVGLSDGRILIKKVRKSRTKGLYHLFSQTEEPLLDVQVEWCAKVKNMVPR